MDISGSLGTHRLTACTLHKASTHLKQHYGPPSLVTSTEHSSVIGSNRGHELTGHKRGIGCLVPQDQPRHQLPSLRKVNLESGKSISSESIPEMKAQDLGVEVATLGPTEASIWKRGKYGGTLGPSELQIA